ncbi:hypothetical protein ACTMSW_06095 [Micromonospora sp. BQ11]|uniref:hypothetical protein n=1 Tax=Micromonospora sp. BQ11 TaxID=3452212 RepID=UPI003F895E7C
MNGRQVSMGVLLALGGLALVVIAGGAVLGADDLAALPVLVLGGGLVLMGMLLARAGARASAPRSVMRARHTGTLGYIPGPTGDHGASYGGLHDDGRDDRHHDDDRHHGGTGDPGGWSSGGDSGGGWSFGGGDSGGGWSSGGGGGDSGGGGGSS